MACRKDISIGFTHFQDVSHDRLEKLYASADTFDSMTNYNVKPMFFSDHCLVSIRFVTMTRRDPRPNWELWKFKAKLQNDAKVSKHVALIRS